MTKIVAYDRGVSLPHNTIRELTKRGFIEEYASGTLRKSFWCGLDVQDMYLHERIAYEFGYAFEMFKKEDIKSIKDVVARVDYPVIKESMWLFERYRTLNTFKKTDVFSFKEVLLKNGENFYGIVVEQTSFLSHEGFSEECYIIAPMTTISTSSYDGSKSFSEVQNPF